GHTRPGSERGVLGWRRLWGQVCNLPKFSGKLQTCPHNLRHPGMNQAPHTSLLLEEHQDRAARSHLDYPLKRVLSGKTDEERLEVVGVSRSRHRWNSQQVLP